MTFNFFKKKITDYKKDEELMIKIFGLLPKEFDYIFRQLNDGILTGVEKLNKEPYTNYTKFSLNVALLNQYEDKKGSFFQIRGIKIFDLDLAKFIDINIDIAYGLLIGYSTPAKEKINPDTTNIQVVGFYIKYFENDDFKNLSAILNKEEVKLLNAADVYEVALKGKKFYHLKDLEDGDFIGIDLDKRLYKITHDPFEIIELKGNISEII